MRVAAWLVVTALALALAAVVAQERVPVAGPSNLPSPAFSLGPVVGSVTQSIDVASGVVETMTVWTRSEGSRPARAEAHLLRSLDGPPIRSAVFEAPLSADPQPTRLPFDPIDVPPETLALRIVAPESGSPALYVAATRNNAYVDGQFVDRLGYAPRDVDLAFSITGHAGALARLRTQASEAPFYLALGVVLAVMAGVAAGGIAWSTLEQARFGRLVASTVGCGVAAATIMGPLLGPVAFL
ncbi:MAG: hypothetical protein OXG43_09370 [Chloroflexi bacterium]|nr:hypothetical protein [Chloroflexota bacterium]